MTKYLIVLPDGTEITSGTGESNAIASVQLTELTNSETELALVPFAHPYWKQPSSPRAHP